MMANLTPDVQEALGRMVRSVAGWSSWCVAGARNHVNDAERRGHPADGAIKIFEVTPESIGQTRSEYDRVIRA
jgi:hypothetical protein